MSTFPGLTRSSKKIPYQTKKKSNMKKEKPVNKNTDIPLINQNHHYNYVPTPNPVPVQRNNPNNTNVIQNQVDDNKTNITK